MKIVKRPRRPAGILAHELPRKTRIRYGKGTSVVVTYPDGSQRTVVDGALLPKAMLLRMVWKNLPTPGAR